MKIVLNTTMKDLDGKDLDGEQQCCVLDKDGNFITKNGQRLITIVKTPKETLTLKKMCTQSLMDFNPQEDAKMERSTKIERYDLAMKIHGAKESIDLDVDELKLVKDIIGDMYSPLIVGQCEKLLGGKEKKEKE